MSALSFPLPFTAALLAVLLMATILRDRASSPRARTLFALFLAAVAGLRVLAGVRLYGVPDAGLAQAAMAMTPAPLSYLAFRSLTDAKTPRPWVDLARHFWPVLLMLALETRHRAPLDLPIVASFAVYAALLARMAGQGPDVFVNTSLGDPARMLLLLRAVVVLHAVSALSDLFLFLDYALAGGAGAAPILAGLNLVLIAALATALLMRPPPPPTQPERPAAAPEDIALAQALDALMTRHRLYADPALTIARLAKRASEPARRVSQAVNRARGLNVSQYINNFRVAEAQRLLARTRAPVTEIMLDAGFLTKSNFNREFRRVTGTSPSDWRRDWRRGGLSPQDAGASAVATGE